MLLYIGSWFGADLSSKFAHKLLRLPVGWFSRRHVGDVLSRFQSVLPIRKMLAEDAPGALVDGFLAIATFGMMLSYSARLGAITAAAIICYALVRYSLLPKVTAAQDEMIVAGGKEQSVLIESIRGIRALRLAGREALRHSLWHTRMDESVAGTIKFQLLQNLQTALKLFIFGIENVISIWFAIRYTMTGDFTLGMTFAYLAYKGQFLIAGSSLVDNFSSFSMLDLHLDRLSDIALADSDISFTSSVDGDADLVGRIELKDIWFSHGMEDVPTLRGVNLVVNPGASVAITGPSGGGKSTLVQLLLGLEEPMRGQIIIDGISLGRFGYKNYQRQIGAVLQDDTLFGGTIAQNISMFENEIDLPRMRKAATDAAIFDEINRMPMQFDTLVGDMGTALSGGQRQRILLARALYRQPKLLILDEGTSHLDEENERRVNDGIRQMGITRIIIAHRAETIKSCDEAYRLESGVLLQMAQHSVTDQIAASR